MKDFLCLKTTTRENKVIREWLLSTLDKVKSGSMSTEDALRELSVYLMRTSIL